MLDYIIKVLLFQTVFLLAYDLFLKKETFFQWNRVYLMATSVLAYVIPMIKIDRVREIVPQEYMIVLPEVVLNPTVVIEQRLDWSVVFFSTLTIVFWIGVGVAAILFAIKLYKVVRLINTHERELNPDFYLVWLKSNQAFSFFNYIFLGRESKNKPQIIAHELVHVHQRHSLDLLFLELQKIVFWFNPFSYLYQARISELHEFIADSIVLKAKDKSAYFQGLLAGTFGVQHISFINPFIKHSLIKKRIIMLNKNRSKHINRLKYLFLFPILIGMLLYVSCENKEEILPEDNSTSELIEQLNAKIEDNSLSEADKKALMQTMMKAIRQNKDENPLGTEERPIFEGKRINADQSDTSVPFAVIENAPIFPGCEDVEDQKQCSRQSIQKHVARNFNTNLTKELDLTPGRKRIVVVFKIDNEGNVADVKARGPHVELETEAVNVIKSLPKMQPGEHQGQKVGVIYTLPITLMVADPHKTENK